MKQRCVESLAAVSEAVSVDHVDLGSLDDAAYDRTILLLLTGAPDPVLAAALPGPSARSRGSCRNVGDQRMRDVVKT